jgi:THO complex subunit 5
MARAQREQCHSWHVLTCVHLHIISIAAPRDNLGHIPTHGTMADQVEDTNITDDSGLRSPIDPSTLDIASLVKTPHNKRLHAAIQTLKSHINALVDYQLEHPKPSKLVTREEIDDEKRVQQEIGAKEKAIRAQLTIVKALYRQGVLKVREEKAKTADDRAVNDALILGLHNLKYEESSLKGEIAAAQNFE